MKNDTPFKGNLIMHEETVEEKWVGGGGGAGKGCLKCNGRQE